MIRQARSEMGRRCWLALKYLVLLTLAALLVLVVAQATDAPSATSLAGVALVLTLLVAVGLTYLLAALVAVTNRRMIGYRRRDGVTVESNDPPIHPIRPRAPGIG